MTVFRLTKGRDSNDLSGKGAELFGGRWNSKGVALLYTRESRALAFVEVAIHIPVGLTPIDYYLITINFPDHGSILELDKKDIPADWRSNPHSHSTQKIGGKFASELKYPVRRVPSAVVQGDFNYLINPAHPFISQVTVEHIEAYEFDSRLL